MALSDIVRTPIFERDQVHFLIQFGYNNKKTYLQMQFGCFYVFLAKFVIEYIF